MKIDALMSTTVRTCRQDDTMSAAAHLMWDDAVGSVAVVDESCAPVGMITDRDICMAAYTRGLPLHEMRVKEAMSQKVWTCHVGDSVESVEETMQRWQVRRLPVVNDDGKVVGILSLTDISLAAARPGVRGTEAIDARAVTATLAGIVEKRTALDGPVTSHRV